MKTKKPIVQMSERTIRTVDSSKYVVQRSVVVFLLLGFYFLWGNKPKWQKVLGVVFLLLIPLTLFFIYYVRATNFWYS
ncbi:hypothetical protein [Stomatobaculum longum]|uniref:hypothetical protein n=1 Tax=Stomatobaculum longum TaxID=796942 RepID=UPI0028F0E691|nr:hypothetical protein [Stomatobaculum longum]